MRHDATNVGVLVIQLDASWLSSSVLPAVESRVQHKHDRLYCDEYRGGVLQMLFFCSDDPNTVVQVDN